MRFTSGNFIIAHLREAMWRLSLEPKHLNTDTWRRPWSGQNTIKPKWLFLSQKGSGRSRQELCILSDRQQSRVESTRTLETKRIWRQISTLWSWTSYWISLSLFWNNKNNNNKYLWVSLGEAGNRVYMKVLHRLLHLCQLAALTMQTVMRAQFRITARS